VGTARIPRLTILFTGRRVLREHALVISTDVGALSTVIRAGGAGFAEVRIPRVKVHGQAGVVPAARLQGLVDARALTLDGSIAFLLVVDADLLLIRGPARALEIALSAAIVRGTTLHLVGPVCALPGAITDVPARNTLSAIDAFPGPGWTGEISGGAACLGVTGVRRCGVTVVTGLVVGFVDAAAHLRVADVYGAGDLVIAKQLAPRNAAVASAGQGLTGLSAITDVAIVTARLGLTGREAITPIPLERRAVEVGAVERAQLYVHAPAVQAEFGIFEALTI